MKNEKILLTILAIAAIAAVVSLSGCTAPSQQTSDKISGKDLFNPANFSMATYVEASNTDNSTPQFIVLSYPKETYGNRITSIEVAGQVSQRTDVWVDKALTHTNKVVSTQISPDVLSVENVSLTYNMTVIDRAWNTMESQYTLVGYDNVTVPAGQYDNCAVYGAKKTLVINGTPNAVSVFYYMHPSSPVPVSYAVEYPNSTIIYGLQSFYAPGDVDSTPERVIQSYMDLLNASEYTQAAQLLVKIDKDGSVHRLSRQDVLKLNDNMAQTYGKKGGKMIVQYVSVDSVQRAADIDGHLATSAHWTSVQYMPSSQMALLIDKTSRVIDVNGHWKIVADDL